MADGARTVEVDAAQRREGGGVIATLREPSFGIFWLSSVCYFIAFGTAGFAFNWLVLELSDSAAQASVVAFTLGIPALLVSLPAGVLYDRVNRRNLIMFASLFGGVVLFALGIVISLDAISVVATVPFALALGVAFGINQPGIQAVVPALVPPERLLSAVSLQTMGSTTGLAVGAALGGLVIIVFGLAGVFYLQAGLLFLSAALMLRVDIPMPSDEQRARPLQMRGEIAEGARFILHDRGLRALMILLAVAGLLMLGPVFALIPDVARAKLGQDAFWAGLLFAITSVGMFAVSLGLASMGELRRMGLIFVATAVTGGAFMIGMGLSESYVITAIVMFVWGLGGGLVVNTNRTLIQSRTRPEMMGRVMAFYSLGFGAARPLGSLLAAGLAVAFDSDGALIVAGVAMIGVTAFFLVTERELREME